MESPDYEQVVKEAAKYLDGTEPGWHKKIDRETLDIGLSCGCIMGQLHGSFGQGMRKHFPHKKDPDMWDSDSPYKFAFGDAFDLDNQDYDSLTKLWLHEISARLEADKRQAAKSADAFIARTTEIINQPLVERV